MRSESGITEELVLRLGRARNMVVFTGSGVSRESGVPTFRGEDGLWQEHRPEELATLEAFERNPEIVWRWYDYRRRLIAEVRPNPAHEAIARLERAFDAFTLVTQNVDGLHARAGSTRTVELHGNIWRARCMGDQDVFDLLENPLSEIPPRCKRCGSLLRPDVVWFGEPMPPEAYDASYEAASSCDAMLVVGTSALVRPAASLPLVAKHNGAFVIEVNITYTPISVLIDVSLIGKAGEVVPELVERLLRVVGEARESAPSSGGVKEHARP